MSTTEDNVAARQRTWRASKFTYFLGLLLRKDVRHLFLTWYAYLRWVDDAVDEGPLATEGKSAFIDRQLLLLENPDLGSGVLLSPEEYLLKILITHDSANNGYLRSQIREMLESIRFDAERSGCRIDYVALRANYYRETSSYLSSIAYFCGMKEDKPPIGFEAAFAAKLSHVVRDFTKDLKHGAQLNMSTEEYSMYSLSTDSEQERAWITVQVRVAERRMLKGRRAVRGCSNWRYKLIVAVLMSKYQAYLHHVRSANFDSQGIVRANPFRFLGNVVTNVAYVFGVVGRDKKSEFAIPKRIIVADSGSLLKLLFSIGPWGTRKGITDLNSTLRSAGAFLEDDIRMRRRFRAGYWLGNSSFQGVAQKLAANRAIAHTASLLFAYWGISAIELDRLQDERLLTKLEITALAERWIHGVHTAVNCQQAQDLLLYRQEHPAHTFAVLSNRLFELIRSVCTSLSSLGFCYHGEHAAFDFARHAEFLMRGQITSFDQCDLSKPRDWEWYYRNIMNHKNVEFALTPFRLWCTDEDARGNFDVLAETFLLLNRAYVHYQLLDDLGDAEEDIRQAIIGAPGYILLSQARLAQQFRSRMHSSLLGVEERVDEGLNQSDKEIIAHTELMCSEFEMSGLFDELRPLLFGDNSSPGNVHFQCAIANTEDELLEPLDKLAARRIGEGADFIAAMRVGNAADARQHLYASNTASRIVSAICEETAVAALKHAIRRSGNSDQKMCLYMMEVLMRKAMIAAVSFASQG